MVIRWESGRNHLWDVEATKRKLTVRVLCTVRLGKRGSEKGNCYANYSFKEVILILIPVPHSLNHFETVLMTLPSDPILKHKRNFFLNSKECFAM